MKVRFHAVESVFDDIQAVQKRIADRAQRVFRERGAAVGQAMDDWLRAERETVWRPAVEIRRRPDAFVVRAAVAGLDARQLDVRATPTELLVSADVHHADRETDGETVLCEFATGPLFRSCVFPEPIDPSRVTAECRNGMLRIIAPLARLATRIEVRTK